MAKQRRKGVNGVGTSITLRFDENDPMEAAALAMSQLLASKHGRRKDAIVAFLAAAYQHYEATGKLLNAVEIANAFQPSEGRTMGFQPTVAVGKPAALPEGSRVRDTAPTIIVTATQKASASDCAGNFLNGMAGFFD